MSRRWARALVWVTPLLAAGAQASASEAEEGKLLYRVHCLACHGESGAGDGPMQDQLEMAVPDLTTLTARHKDEFPVEEVQQIIDGRRESPAHGTREMPVWGFTFQSTGRDTDQEGEVQEMISALTAYLESLQQDHGPAADR